MLDVPHYIHDGGLDTSDKSVVVDWYYKKLSPEGRSVLHYCKFCNGVEMCIRDSLYTYRAPHLKESYETFAKGPAELAGRDYTEKDMNEIIVGAAAKLDTPRKPREEAASTDCKYFCGITDEMTVAERKSLCSVDAATLKAEAADLSARMEKGVRVVFGSKEAVEAAKELFDRVETL